MSDQPPPDEPKPETGRVYPIDPETGIRFIKDWGNSCYRGFVSDSRFGGGQVIKRTNRNTTREWRKLDKEK